MFELITYASYISLLILLNWIDYRVYKTIINPIFCLSIPFSVVLVVCLLFNERLGFIPFYSPSLWLWSVGLSLFWIGGHLITLVSRRITTHRVQEYASGNLVHIVFLACIGFMTAKLLATGGDMAIGSKELGEEVSVGGVVGRVANILMIAFPFYVYERVNKYIKFLLLALLFVFLTTLGTKTWLMATVLAAIILLISTKRLKLNLKLLISAFFILAALFFLYYYLVLYDRMDSFNRIVEFVSRHFYFYFTSGILPMGEFVRENDFNTINSYFHPIVGLIKTWNGEQIMEHSNVWITTDQLLGTQSNVFTFFGTFYMSGTIWTYIFYSIFYGLWCYLFYEISRVQNNVFLHIANAFNCAILFFGWYNCGFGLLRIWEIVILSCVLYFISRVSVVHTKH